MLGTGEEAWTRNITAATVNDPLNNVGDYELKVETMEVLPPWQNPANPLDVNLNNSVEPLDALIIINRLNQGLGGSLPGPGIDGPPRFFDVNGNYLGTSKQILKNLLTSKMLLQL